MRPFLLLLSLAVIAAGSVPASYGLRRMLGWVKLLW